MKLYSTLIVFWNSTRELSPQKTVVGWLAAKHVSIFIHFSSKLIQLKRNYYPSWQGGRGDCEGFLEDAFHTCSLFTLITRYASDDGNLLLLLS